MKWDIIADPIAIERKKSCESTHVNLTTEFKWTNSLILHTVKTHPYGIGTLDSSTT